MSKFTVLAGFGLNLLFFDHILFRPVSYGDLKYVIILPPSKLTTPVLLLRAGRFARNLLLILIIREFYLVTVEHLAQLIKTLVDLLDIFGGLFQLGALEFYHFPRRLDLFGDAVNHARVDLVVLSL